MFRWLFPKSCKRLKVFVSYSRSDKSLAQEIAQTLRNQGDKVFFDVDSLLPAVDFNAQIYKSVRKSDRFVFLASQSSLSDGSYTLTELDAVKSSWPSPVGRVLTVIADDSVNPTELDPYLRSVHVLDPSGNIVAEIANAINISRPVGLFCRIVALMGAGGLFAVAAFGAITVFGTPTQKTAAIDMSEGISIGHWTGTSTVVSRLTFRNDTKEKVTFSMGFGELESPSGKIFELEPSAILVNGLDQPPLPLVIIEPKSAQTFDSEYRARMVATYDIHAEIYQDMMAGRYATITKPESNVFSEARTTALINAAKKDWNWEAGDWTFRVLYQVGPSAGSGPTISEALEFEVTDTDITEMLRLMDDYHTAAGVVVNWRHYDKYGALATRYKVGRQPGATESTSD